MTDNGQGSQDPLAKKLKSSATATDYINSCIDEKGANNKNKPGNANVIMLHPNSTVSPEESVFSIDHILESIFAELDRKSLLNSRLVSRRWAHFSSKSLQKIITFKIARSKLNKNVLFCNGREDWTINDLITLMNNSTNFPCASFTVKGQLSRLMGKAEPLAQRFFTAHGAFIKKLTFQQDLLLSDLKRLLLTQAPNLEQLVLDWVKIRYTKTELRLQKFETEDEGRRRRESLLRNTTNDLQPLLKNLKVFKIVRLLGWGDKFPDIFMEQLLECSPNLVEVYERNNSFLHSLARVNRIHLLKKLEIFLDEEILVVLQAMSTNRQDNWAVKVLEFNDFQFYTDIDFIPRATEDVCKMLKACSSTCQKLWWDEGYVNFYIPQMPKVKHFCFFYYENEETGIPARIFPEGVSLSDALPNLRTLAITSWNHDLENVNIDSLFWNNNDPVPVPNVRKVYLRFAPNQNVIQHFREMFPNAVLYKDDDSSDEEDEWGGRC